MAKETGIEEQRSAGSVTPRVVTKAGEVYENEVDAADIFTDAALTGTLIVEATSDEGATWEPVASATISGGRQMKDLRGNGLPAVRVLADGREYRTRIAWNKLTDFSVAHEARVVVASDRFPDIDMLKAVERRRRGL